jgi:hypothetical protein
MGFREKGALLVPETGSRKGDDCMAPQGGRWGLGTLDQRIFERHVTDTVAVKSRVTLMEERYLNILFLEVGGIRSGP